MNTQSKSAQSEQNQIDNSTTSNELTDEQLEQIANFPEAISNEEMFSMEKIAGSNAAGVQRLLCLLACTGSSKILSELSLSNPEAFCEMLEAVESFKEHAEGLAEIAETALVRMEIVKAITHEQKTKTGENQQA